MTSDIVVHIAHKLATVKNVSVNVSDTSPRTSSTMENEDANVAENRNATNAGTLSEASRQRTFRRNCFVFSLFTSFFTSFTSSKERERERYQRLLRIPHEEKRNKRERGERIQRERDDDVNKKRKRPQKNRAPHPPRRRGRETCPSRRRFREARATFIRVCV